jgi:hypothetical protein
VFLVIILIFFAVAFVFLIVVILIWFLAKEGIGSRRAIRRVCVEALWAYSAHVQCYSVPVGKSSGCYLRALAD